MKHPFERVVEQHAATVLRVCQAVLGAQDAEDAWSETFIAAMRAYPQLPETANVQAWLVTIAHRKALDAVRSARRQPLPVGELPEGRQSAGPEPGEPELWEHVRALPDKQRQAIAYRYVAGLPYSEIADLIGGNADAARRAAADGIKSLRKKYSGAAMKGARP
jgi:RNA polymerase sigma factor (sigma-70 family)